MDQENRQGLDRSPGLFYGWLMVAAGHRIFIMCFGYGDFILNCCQPSSPFNL